jgi:alkaline phosphatase D
MTDGPVVGGVTDVRARIFARTGVAASVAVKYSTNANLANPVTSGALSTSSVHDFTAIVEIDGLKALTKYYYTILVNGKAQESSPYPSFTTFPAAGSNTSFNFSVFSDLQTTTNDPTVGAPAYQAGYSLGSAFALQIGDFDHRDPQTLADMRLMHRQVRGPYDAAGSDFATYIGPTMPLDHVFDDHDYGMDNGNQFWQGKAAAIQAYEEYYPTYDLPNPTNGIWHDFTYGMADFFMLDLRTQRDANANPDGPNHSMLDGTHIANGEKEWLKAALLASKAKWKFIISTVPFNPTAKGVEGDPWGGYQYERAELLNFIKSNNITGVIIISGDLHSGGGIDDGTNSGLPEVSTPHTNLVDSRTTGNAGIWSQGIFPGLNHPGFDYIQVFNDHVVLQTHGADGTLRISYTLNAGSSPPPGPAVWSVLLSPHPASQVPPTVVATLHDYQGENIIAAEYFLGSPGANGSGTAMAAQDGQFNSPDEVAQATLNGSVFAALPDSNYYVFVHALDANGHWGPFEVTEFYKDTVAPVTSHLSVSPKTNITVPPKIKAQIDDTNTGSSSISAAEYFIDTVGTNGTGTAMTPTDGSFVKATAWVSSTVDATRFGQLAAGQHTVYVHGMDAAGNWGPLVSITFTKAQSSHAVGGALALSSQQASLAGDRRTELSTPAPLDFQIDLSARVAAATGDAPAKTPRGDHSQHGADYPRIALANDAADWLNRNTLIARDDYFAELR